MVNELGSLYSDFLFHKPAQAQIIRLMRKLLTLEEPSFPQLYLHVSVATESHVWVKKQL